MEIFDYKLDPVIAAQYPVCLVSLNEVKKPVNIHGIDATVNIEGDAQNPPSKRTVKGATQSEMKHFYEKGHPFIIKVPRQDIAKAEKQ